MSCKFEVVCSKLGRVYSSVVVIADVRMVPHCYSSQNSIAMVVSVAKKNEQATDISLHRCSIGPREIKLHHGLSWGGGGGGGGGRVL